MSERVGGIYYDATIETKGLIDGERQARRALASVGDAADKLSSSLTITATAVKLYAAALAAVKAIQFADDMRLLAVRVDVAAGSVQKGAEALRELQAIAARTQTSVSANADVFARLNQSMLQMGGTQRDTLRLTELLGMAIRVSGASAQEARSAMLQFGQALGSGKLAGDELRSLMENAPYLMRQLADGIGVPIGALKGLGEQGKLTSDVVVAALTKAGERIREDFAKVPQTFAGAMALLADAAGRATVGIDTVSGTSAVATGVLRGLAEVVDGLGRQLADASTEADRLGRNSVVEEWARKSTIAFSYLADAADITWQTVSVLGRNVGFVLETIGSQIGGIGAMAAAAARGQFAQARQIWNEMAADDARRRSDLDRRDAETLRDRLLAGQRIRQQMDALAGGTDGSDPLDRRARSAGPGSKLRPTAGDDGRRKFDVDKYIAHLREQMLAGYDLIDAQEAEALRVMERQAREAPELAARKEEARTAIESLYAQKRLDLQLRHAEDARQAIEEAGRDELEEVMRAQQERVRVETEAAKGRALASGIIGRSDPIAAMQSELEDKSALLLYYATIDQANAELYAAAQVDLERETSRKILEIKRQEAEQQAQMQAQTFGLYSRTADQIYNVFEQSGRKRSALAKALFLTSKALAVAEILINTEVAASKIQAQLGVYGAPLAMATRIQGYASAGIVAGTALADAFGGGRAYGGPVAAGSLYRVNEAGRPEMFTASNGSQYMLPTSGGRVTAADQVGSGGGVQVLVQVQNSHPTAAIDVQQSSDGRIVQLAVSEVANQVAEHRGQVWSAFRANTNLGPKL